MALCGDALHESVNEHACRRQVAGPEIPLISLAPVVPTQSLSDLAAFVC